MKDTISSIQALHHVALPFPGNQQAVDAARRFYGDLVGLGELTVPPTLEGVLWFDAGEKTELHLYTDPQASATRWPRHPCLRVTGLAGLRERLRETGVELIEPGDDIPGRKRFFAFDPFGNALEFAEFD